MSASSQAIFLSYASQDADAARRVCDALRAAGLEVWFDQSELRGGDAWDASIRKQIKECSLFVPIISNNTQAREEGYFRLEWKLAVDRSHLMADDKAFFFPVVLNDVAEPKARVPDKFRERQWSRLNDDTATTMFAERIAKLIAGGASSGWWYFVPLIVLFIMLFLWLFAWGWLQQVALSARADDMLAKQRARKARDQEN